MSTSKRAQQIAPLNDTFRATFIGGKVMLTAGIAALPETDQQAILQAVQQFNNFTPDNDLYGEHDFWLTNLPKPAHLL